MKLTILVKKVEMQQSSISGIKTYTISGTRWGNVIMLELSRPEWEALSKAHGYPINVDDEMEITLPGELNEEEV